MASYFVRTRIPQEVKAPLDADVARTGKTEAEIVREIIAKHYRVKITTPLRVGRPPKTHQ